MNFLLRLQFPFLRHLSEILGKVHALGIILLIGCTDRTHLGKMVSNRLFFCKNQYLVVTVKDSLGYSYMDNTQNIALDNKHGHRSLKLDTFIDAEIAYSYVKCVDHLI